MTRVEHQITINAAREHVFDIIVDYERYPEFLPDMQAVQLISREDGIALVRFEIEILMRIGYSLRLTEERPELCARLVSDAGSGRIDE